MPKFRVGDRVRVIRKLAGCSVGQCGTVMEESTCPWIRFDTPTGCPASPSGLDIPEGYAECPYEGDLELIEDKEVTDNEISVLEEVAQLSSYYGVDIAITMGDQTIHVKSNTKFNV